MKVSLDDLKLGDLMDIEAQTGKPASELFPDGQFTAAGLVGIVWAMRRRQDPTFTFEQAKDVGFDDLEFGDGADPTSAAGN